jgi:hypothetical protein
MNDSAKHVGQSVGITENMTQHLADLTQACARSSELLARNLTLRQIASNLINPAVRALNLKVSSPEAIFFNHLDADEQVVSIALPDLLVDAMRHGDSVMENGDSAFFTRHDSLDAEHELSPDQNQALRHAVARVSRTLSETYQAHLDEVWQKPVIAVEYQQPVDTAVEALIQQQRLALDTELVLCGYSAMVSAQEQQWLSGVIQGSTDGVFSLEWATSEGNRIHVPSAYVVSETVQSDGQPSGVVFLIMPARSIERFESVATLREALGDKLEGPLKDALLIRDLAQFGDQHTVDPDGWLFKPVTDSLITTHVHEVRHKQTEDCRFLLARGADATDRHEFYTQLESVQVCAHLEEAMGQRFNLWLAKLSEVAEPHWRKYGDATQKAHLLRLEQAHADRQKKVDDLFGHLHSLETFAHAEMTQYMSQLLGRVIDPRRVWINIHDSLQLGPGDSLNSAYQYSLLEAAIHGVDVSAAGMRLITPTGQLHADFSAAFVKDMFDKLNFHHRYQEALKQCLTDKNVLCAMTRHRDSAIALGAQAAKMQGHLLQDRSHELVHKIGGEHHEQGVIRSIGSLHLTATDSRFRDMIVIEERGGTDEHYVLYAPGAPDGRDFFEFATWRQLSFHVGGWLADESGRNYLHGQLFGPSKSAAIAFLDDARLNPGVWKLDSCVLVRCTGPDFESNLSTLVHQKALSSFSFFNGEALPVADLPAYASLSTLAMLNARINVLNKRFTELSPGLMSLREYVKKETSELLNDYLQRGGYAEHIDPDTLYLGLGIPYTETPDYGKNSDLRSLTDLMMFGSEDILSYRPLIHLYSSAGLDVRELPLKLISFIDKQVREADLGARYMNYLTTEFLGRQHPLHERRKAILAKRIQCEMTRSALVMFHRGEMSLAQYSWLRDTIDGLTVGASVAETAHTAVSEFKIADQTVEGVYIFRDFNSQDPLYNLLYTPGAPDGRDYRPLSDYAQLLTSQEMQRYYSSRVAHAGQQAMATFMDQFVRGRKHEPDYIRIDNRPENRIVDTNQLYGNLIERMIADADSQTQSLAEKRMALAYTIIKWTGTIVFLPFPSLSLGWGLFTTTLTFVEAFDAYASGDRAAAIPLFVSGALGVISGGDGVRTLIMGGQGFARMVSTNAGLWAWKKLDLCTVYRLTA